MTLRIDQGVVDLLGAAHLKEQLKDFIEGDEGQAYIALLQEQYYQNDGDEDGEDQDEDEDEDNSDYR